MFYGFYTLINVSQRYKIGNKSLVLRKGEQTFGTLHRVITFESKLFRGHDAVYKLIKNLLEEEKEMQKIIKQNFNKEMIISKKGPMILKMLKSFPICNKEYKKGDAPVRDHCHITGKYRESAHANCNLSYRLTHKIYVIFHSLRGYDSHLIMQEIGKFNKDINVIPNTMEKYMEFMIDNLIFTDSFQFMNRKLYLCYIS